jgi:hypothetical protein
MIAEAAYYLAEKRAFAGCHSLEDWLAAEEQIRLAIAPTREPEDKMNDTNTPSGPASGGKALVSDTEQAGDASRTVTSKPSPTVSQQPGSSRFQKYAVTQAAGDGIEGDVLKPDKTADEKIGANMADRK